MKKMVWKKKGRKRKPEKIRKRGIKKPKMKIKMSEWMEKNIGWSYKN